MVKERRITIVEGQGYDPDLEEYIEVDFAVDLDILERIANTKVLAILSAIQEDGNYKILIKNHLNQSQKIEIDLDDFVSNLPIWQVGNEVKVYVKACTYGVEVDYFDIAALATMSKNKIKINNFAFYIEIECKKEGFEFMEVYQIENEFGVPERLRIL